MRLWVAAIATHCLVVALGSAETQRSGRGPLRVGEPPSNEAVVVRLPDDSLRMFYIVRPSGDELRSRESADNGMTWGNDRIEFPLPGKAYYAVQVLVDREGEFQAIFHIAGTGPNGHNGRTYDVWHNRTVAKRQEWSTPRRIHEGYTGSLRGFTMLRSGRLLLAMSVAVPQRAAAVPGRIDYGWNDAIVMWSDDRGQTWRQSDDRLQVVQDEARGRTRYGAVEPHLRELLDGRIWMLIRTKNGFLYESYSSDDGMRWPEPTASRFISSDSPANTVRLKDGRLVLLFNSCQRWDDLRSYAIGGREVLHAAISDDDGKTWRGFREVLRDAQGQGKGDRGTAYPWAEETADSRIVFISGQGEGRRAIMVFDPDWLLEQSQSDEFSEADSQWTGYEAQGMQVIGHPARSGANVMLLSKPKAEAPAGAVWNFPMGRRGKLEMRVMPRDGFQGAALSLTDHFSVSGDNLADAHAIHSFRLNPDGSGLAPGRWHDLIIEWNNVEGATMEIDGQPAGRFEPRRVPSFGINYLRLSSTARTTDSAGLMVERVSVSITDPRPAQPAIDR